MNTTSPFLAASPEQIALFRTIWAAFLSGGEWPLFQYVEERLEEDQDPSATEIVQSCPRYQSVSYGPIWSPSFGVPRMSKPSDLLSLASCI